MKPHQAGLEISYSATWQQAEETGAGSAITADASYTVARGDTLWGISKKFYGTGTKYLVIYNANKELIEAMAKAHGRKSSYKDSSAGWWIWAGEVLTIPGVSSSTASKGVTESKGAPDPQLGERITLQTTEFTYSDVASGESDRVRITMQDIGKEWMGTLMPEKGAIIGAKLRLINWRDSEETDTFDCGLFVLDDISFSGRPLKCTLGGVSVPVMDDFRVLPVTNTWENTTIKEIASQIAAKAGVSLHYEADRIPIAEVEQSRQPDSAFLYSLCEKYGLAMKVYDHKIIIFDIALYEEKEAVLTIRETDTLSWSFNTTIDGTYTGVELDYTDPDEEDTIKVTMGLPGRMYTLNTQASGRYDAELQAAAKVNAANRKMQTMSLTIRADPRAVVASQCVMAEGFGKLDGKYYVDQINHSLGSGYNMKLSMHKVQAAIRAATGANTVSGSGQTYTVVKGDNLWMISKKFYGAGAKYQVIYDANKELIETTARAHGKKTSEGGHWLWAGEILTIPEV